MLKNITVQKKNVLVLTSTNLSCNPRCLKEVRLLTKKGIQVTVISFRLHNWTDANELDLRSELLGVRFIYMDATRSNLFTWLIASFTSCFAKLLFPFFSKNLHLSGHVVGKQNLLLKWWSRKNKVKFDLIIAHNPPTFYTAYCLGKRLNKPFALDIEDFHPGESNSEVEKKAVAFLMQYLIPRAIYTSFASPLILKETALMINENVNDKLILVNNSFTIEEFPAIPAVVNQFTSLKLVWFSQFVDYNRGLENILSQLDAYADKISLTLIGNMRPDFYNAVIQHRHYINCLSSMPQKDLHHQLQQYDAGLALEDGTINFNRNICLTNKIWAYLQSGLYILATATAAQVQFLIEHPSHGVVFSLDKQNFNEQFLKILSSKNNIRNNQSLRHQQAKSYAWDVDGLSLLDKWQLIFK